MNRLLVKNAFAAMLAIMLAIGVFSLPQPVKAESGVCQCNPATPCNGNNCSTSCPTVGTSDGCGTQVCSGVVGTCVAGSSSSGTSGGSGGTTTTTPGSTAGSLTNPLSGVCSSIKETDPQAGQKCVQLVIGNIIKTALGIIGSIALLMVTWGGFLWLTAMGNDSRVEKGKETLIWATIGLTVVFGAYAIASYIIDKLVAGK